MKNIYVIALAAILFQGCGQKKEMTVPATRPVKTTIVESRSVIRKDFSGIVEAVEYVKLAFRVSGQIISLPVIEGEKVKKGQLIAAIDPRDIALQYAATKSAYETASAQVERNKRLLSRQAISVQEYEISLSNYQKAKSEYELSSNNMRDTKLTGPFRRFYREAVGGELPACQFRRRDRTTGQHTEPAYQVHHTGCISLSPPCQRSPFPCRV